MTSRGRAWCSVLILLACVWLGCPATAQGGAGPGGAPGGAVVEGDGQAMSDQQPVDTAWIETIIEGLDTDDVLAVRDAVVRVLREVDAGGAVAGGVRTVRGQLLDGAGAPIAGATVQVLDRRTRSRYASLQTDDEGGFEFRRPGAGALRFVASDAAGGLAVRDVGVGESDIEIRMDPPQRVRLHVVDASGRPCPQATAHWVPENRYLQHLEPARTATGGADGVVPLDLPARLPVLVSINGGPGFQSVELVVVGDAAEPDLTVTCPVAVPSSGRVVGDDGEAIGGVELVLRSTEQTLRSTVSGVTNGTVLATTDADGRFTLDRLASGARYRIEASMDGYLPATLERVVPGQADLLAVLERPVALAGVVVGDLDALRDEPDAPVHVHARQSAGPGQAVTQSTALVAVDDAGVARFELEGLRRGPVELRLDESTRGVVVELPGGVGPEGVVLRAPEAQATPAVDPRVEAAQRMRAEAQAEAQALRAAQSAELEAAPARELVLKLIRPRGWPGLEGEVTLMVREGERTRTEQLPIEAGRVTVEVRDVEQLAYVLQPPAFAGLVVDAQGRPNSWVPLTAEERGAGETPDAPIVATVDLVPAGLVAGVVLDDAGLPAAGVNVMVRSQTRLPTTRVVTDAWGRFLLHPVPMDAQLSLSAQPTDTTVGVGTLEVVGPTADRPLVSATIRLGSTRTVSVEVRGEDGEPVAAARVMLDVRAAALMRRVVGYTDAAGRVNLVGVPDDAGLDQAQVTLYVNDVAGYVDRRMPTKLGEGPLRVELLRGRTLGGVIRHAETGEPIPFIRVQASGRQRGQAHVNSTADASGRFELTGMSSGPYMLIVRDGYYPPGSVRVQGKDRFSVRYGPNPYPEVSIDPDAPTPDVKIEVMPMDELPIDKP